MPIIDSHVHIWANNPAFPWAAEAIDPPQYEAHPQRLLESMQTESIAGAVLVQYIGYRWDNRYVAQALKNFPQKFMGVCRVNPEDPDAPDQLSEWTEDHGFHGVRISPEADGRGDWFRSSLIKPFFQRAADLKIPIVILTKPSRLPDLLELLDAVPDVDVVIDHIADCNVLDRSHQQMLRALAQHTRVFLKTGHVWANSATDYPWRDQHALLKFSGELFGVERMMWGSDWSFCLRRATYAQSLAYIRDEIDFWSQAELTWILGGTALRLWRFSQILQPEHLAAVKG